MKWGILIQIWDTHQLKPLSSGFLVKENMQVGADVDKLLKRDLIFAQHTTIVLLKSHTFCID